MKTIEKNETDDSTQQEPLVSAIKHGIKTTEFWATIIGSILVSGFAEFHIHLNETSVIGITSMVLTYVIGRIFHKHVQVKKVERVLKASKNSSNPSAYPEKPA